MLNHLVIALPMLVCIFWGVFFLIRLIEHRAEELRVTVMLLLFYGIAAMLYADHWLYFSGAASTIGEYTYLIANLCVYPLYYAYLRALTRAKRDNEVFLLLLPAAIVAVLFPVFVYYEYDSQLAELRFFARIGFAFLVVWIWVRGYQLLHHTKERMDNTYSDYRSHLLRPAHIMLQLFGITAAVSMLLNLIGREFFAGNTGVAIPAVVMSMLLYGLGYTAAHTVVPSETVQEESEETATAEETDELMRLIEKTLQEQQLYRNSSLTIQDLAAAVGSNRTYISNTINRNCALSFSQYIARFRVEHAKQVLCDSQYTTDHDAISAAAALSGFNSDQAFYRVFKEVTGTTPLAYRQQNA